MLGMDDAVCTVIWIENHNIVTMLDSKNKTCKTWRQFYVGKRNAPESLVSECQLLQISVPVRDVYFG